MEKWIGERIPRSVLTRDQEAHGHYQAHEQAENPQRIQGGEARRALGVYRSDKGGDEPAFVRIGSKYSFLHRLINSINHANQTLKSIKPCSSQLPGRAIIPA